MAKVEVFQFIHQKSFELFQFFKQNYHNH